MVKQSLHSGFLDHWNSQKSVCNIWQGFLCLLDEEIPKIWKKIEFSRWLFELPAKQHTQFSPSGSTYLPCLSLPSKNHRENSIFSIFLESPHQIDMKNIVKCYKHFFGYFNALETYGVTRWMTYHQSVWCLFFSHATAIW